TILLNQKAKPISERVRAATPQPATPAAVLKVIADLAKKQPAFDRVSVVFPGVVRDGITETAFNLHRRFIGFHLARELQRRLHKPVRVCNDADVQGYGAVKNR